MKRIKQEKEESDAAVAKQEQVKNQQRTEEKDERKRLLERKAEIIEERKRINEEMTGQINGGMENAEKQNILRGKLKSIGKEETTINEKLCDITKANFGCSGRKAKRVAAHLPGMNGEWERRWRRQKERGIKMK